LPNVTGSYNDEVIRLQVEQNKVRDAEATKARAILADFAGKTAEAVSHAEAKGRRGGYTYGREVGRAEAERAFMAPLGWAEARRVNRVMKDGDEIEAAEQLSGWAVAFEGGEAADFHVAGEAWKEPFTRDLQHGEEGDPGSQYRQADGDGKADGTENGE
jgi:hypothetical protein